MRECGNCDRFPESGPSEVGKLGNLDVSKQLKGDTRPIAKLLMQ